MSSTFEAPALGLLEWAGLSLLAQREAGEQITPTFRGAALEAQGITSHEWLLAGPAETGKTWACIWRLDELLRSTPKAKAALVRKVRADMTGTVLETYERLALARGGVTAFGGRHPEFYEYENGARLYLGGMDRPEKVLSGERDWIVVNQAEEFTLEDWETLTTRCTGRGCVTDTPMIFGDCNPGPPGHWILHRDSLNVLHSRHTDNPTLYDDAGELTAQGVRTFAVLDSLTGIRRARLRDGQWVAAEGIVYSEFSRDVHVVRRFEIPSYWRRVAAIDFGYQNPFSYIEAAVSPDGVIVVDLQFYGVQTLCEDWARRILAERARRGLPPLEAVVADHDNEDRATLARHGIQSAPAVKEIANGIQKVQARLRPWAPGKGPGLVIFEDSLVERDPILAAEHKPCGLVEEFEVYVYPDGVDGKPMREIPRDVDNHAADAARYLVEYVERTRGPQLPLGVRVEARLEADRAAGRLPNPETNPTDHYLVKMKVIETEQAKTAFRVPAWARGLRGRRTR